MAKSTLIAKCIIGGGNWRIRRTPLFYPKSLATLPSALRRTRTVDL